jgi:hypothetical protein
MDTPDGDADPVEAGRGDVHEVLFSNEGLIVLGHFGLGLVTHGDGEGPLVDYIRAGLVEPFLIDARADERLVRDERENCSRSTG